MSLHEQTPFPNEPKTKALQAEDEFMREHGALGSRCIYLAVEAISSRCALIVRSIAQR